MPPIPFTWVATAPSPRSVRCSAATSTHRRVEGAENAAGTKGKQVASLRHGCYPSDDLAPGPLGPVRKRHAPRTRQGGHRVRAGSIEEEIRTMPQTPKRWSLKGVALAASLTVVFAACGGAATTPSPSSAAPASTAPSAAPASAGTSAAPSAAAFTGMTYPETGEAPCGVAPYAGNLKKITAIDALTVEFQLCNPDAAFLPKVAFSAFGIQDSDYLTAHATDGKLLDTPNGTGPYKLKEWSKGNRMVWEANPDYWGGAPKTAGLEFRWSDESAARLLDLQSGTVDGMDNPGTPDIATIQGDANLAFYPRAGLNTLFLGFNNTIKPWDDVRVRQAIAMGIDREQIVKNFFPEGST